MHQIADDLHQIAVMPFSSVNAYVAGGVLFDAGTRQSKNTLLKALRGHAVTAHALTHAHPDHQGSSHAACTALGIPLWCGAGDADAMTTGRFETLIPPSVVTRLIDAVWTGPPHPVDRRLEEGDEVGGFTVIETPGHSPGHVVFWRERDRVLIIGDVLRNMSYATLRPSLREPPAAFTPDPAQNRASARKLLGLNPAVVAFGHGPPLRDSGRFNEFVSNLAA
jgi:glyoxylase-like metal-dependent hydrolase (beta-lactamase superfamily II)